MHTGRKPTTFVGIDVGGKELVVELLRNKAEPKRLTLPNTSSGHATLLRAIKKRAGTARVTLEPTGTYHLDLASSDPPVILRVEVKSTAPLGPHITIHLSEAERRLATTHLSDNAPPSPSGLRFEWRLHCYQGLGRCWDLTDHVAEVLRSQAVMEAATTLLDQALMPESYALRVTLGSTA